MDTKIKRSKSELLVLNTYIKLIRARESVARHVRPTIESFGLTIAQFGTMEMIYHLGPQTQKVIGNKLLWSGGNVTQVVDNLERNGLVKRNPVPEDRRAYHVSLTENGHDLIEKVFDQHLQDISRIFGVLSEPEQQKLGELCKRLGTSIE